MKVLILFLAQVISFSIFARSPAVLPEYKIEPMSGPTVGTQDATGKSYNHQNAGFEFGKLSTKNNVPSTPVNQRPTNKAVPIYFALLGLSLPLMAWVFFKDARDMRRIFDPTKREDENVIPVDFSKDEEEDEEKKAAS